MLIAIEAEDKQSKPATNSRSFHPEGENHEDASCCRHSCDGDRSPRSGEGEAGEIGAPARLSVVGATRQLPRLPSAGLVPRLVIELLIFGRRLVRGSLDICTVPPLSMPSDAVCDGNLAFLLQMSKVVGAKTHVRQPAAYPFQHFVKNQRYGPIPSS